MAAGSGERRVSRRCQGNGFWGRFMSLIQEDGCNGPGSFCLDLRRVVWGCDGISTWLIRVQRSEARSISYLHLFNNYFLSTCYISSSVHKTQTQAPYSFLLSGMASPRAPVCTRNYWGKYIKIENILYFIEDTGYWRVALGDGNGRQGGNKDIRRHSPGHPQEWSS